MIENLDLDMKNFIDKYLTSFLVWDLLVFFHKNQTFPNDPVEISKKLGRRAEDIEMAMSELVKNSILEEKNAVYECTKRAEIKSMIDRFVRALDNREHRLLILSEVLKKR